MRAKKNREVNIYSASVVDLFASGMGVFLIVSIIALKNQQKESSKTDLGEKSNLIVTQMEGEIESLSAKLDKISDENFKLKAKHLIGKVDSKNSEKKVENKREVEVLKSKMANQNTDHKVELEKLKVKLEKSLSKIYNLEKNIALQRSSEKLGNTGTGPSFNHFEVGTKIRLENVHFYPGTDRSIEPYSRREIRAFARYLIQNPKVTVEVSGHIYETKRAIESGKAEDIYNLSGSRARHVCRTLVGFGVHEKRLSCVGYGAERSVYLTNDQYSEKAQKNRRVEIEILSK